ncbi:hypothetical protein EGP98_06280 [bacterium]|nr:hypothetical protein [bacterium]
MKKILSNFDLKILAIITMTIDHIGAIIYPNIDAFRIIGRISFPIFCFLLVEGFKHTHNRFRYFIRLLLFAIITQPIYDYAFNNHELNILFTFSLSFLLLSSIEFIKKIINKYNKGIENYLYKTISYLLIYIIFLILSIILNVDYQALGISLVLIFYLSPNILLSLLLYLTIAITLNVNNIQLYSLIAFIFIYFYNGKKGKNIKYFFYLYYPLHLLLLKGLSILS